MERVEKSIEVRCPVSTVYDQWTQFEEFPRIMDGVREVRQVDDTHLHWRATVGGKEVEWDAEIVEQVPDQRIAWRSVSGAPNAGSVRFEPIDADRTRVWLTLEYEPRGVAENVGDALGVMTAKVSRSLDAFKKFIEDRAVETGAWRGEVRAGRPSAVARESRHEARAEAARTTTPAAPPRTAWDETLGVMRRMVEDMDGLLAGFGWPSRLGRWHGEDRRWSPRVELEQRGDELVVTADLPGIKREDVQLEVDDHRLIVQGERRSLRETSEEGLYRTEREYGSFYRAIRLPDNAEPDSARATMDDGVLTIRIRAPREARREGRRVSIERA
jgi:HSP20 family molecular chaperone IbpA/uncharacterized membrane protein